MVAGFFVRDPYLPLGEVRRDGRSIVDEGDVEGFSAGAAQFDSDS